MTNDDLRNALGEMDGKLTVILSTLCVITWSINLQFQSCDNEFEASLGAALEGVYQSLGQLQDQYQSVSIQLDNLLKEGLKNGKE